MGLTENQKNNILEILNIDIQKLNNLKLQTQVQNEALQLLKEIKDEEERIKIVVDSRMKLITHEQKLQETAASSAADLRSEELRLLELHFSQNKILKDEYNKQKRIIEQITAEEDYKVKRQAIINKYKAQEVQLEEKLKSTKLSSTEAQEERSRVEAQKQAELSALDALKRAQDRYSASIVTLTERQEGYEKVFLDSFDRMSDVLLNFTETGKLNFQDMIDSMIRDLIRFELKQMQMQMLKGMGGSAIGFFGSLFRGLFGSRAGIPTSTQASFFQNFSTANIGFGAKGAYFSGSSSNWSSDAFQKFAKGGAFTNSIVDNPTIFKFAKGVGMMGEAGPEAIMPLKRDSSGNLGVRAQGSKTEVIVNNYGDQKASAEETVDSRGNRRIEVTIGEMTAGEISRTGSGTQNTLRGTFGLRPQLVRR